MGATPVKTPSTGKGMTLEQLQAQGATPVTSAPVSVTESPKKSGGVLGAVKNFGIGAYKGAASTVANVGSAGQKTLDIVAKDVMSMAGKPYKPSPTLKETFAGTKAITPEGTAQKIGYGAEQVAEFFAPTGVAGKVGKAVEVAGMGSKTVKAVKLATEGLGVAGVTKAQGGSNKATLENVATAGAFGLAGKAIGKVADKIAPRMINSLIKPLSKDFEFGKNPGLGVVREKISANSFEDLIGKLNLKRAEVGTEIGQVLKHPKVAAQQIDLTKALSPIDEAIQKATKTGDQSMINALLDFRNGITNDFALVEGKLVSTGTKNLKVNPEGALQFKMNVGDSVRWREGVDNELNKVKTKVYRQARDLMEAAVDKARASDKSIPSIRTLNERFANLTSAETAAKYRANIQKRLNLSTIGGTATGALVQGGSLAQNLKEGDIEGIAKDLLTIGAFGLGGKALGSVAVKTRAAKMIASLSPEQRSILSKAIPLIKNVVLSQNQR